MMRALWTAATGMTSQQFNVDVISNNLANVNTVGFKKMRADFEDLIYQHIQLSGSPVDGQTQRPVPVDVGHGSRVAATARLFSQGSLQQTGNPLDLAIAGDGFFQIQLPDGRIAYTRDGSFKKDALGRVMTSDGYLLVPPITIPPNATEVNITEDGVVTVKLPTQTQPVEVGRITLARFVNPAGLKNIGKNLYMETAASGAPMVGTPARGEYGSIHQGFLEMSNVNVVDEMVSLIVAQRAYEFNARAVQTSDSMLATANTLKR